MNNCAPPPPPNYRSTYGPGAHTFPQLISFEINCFFGLLTRLYKYGASLNFQSGYAKGHNKSHDESHPGVCEHTKKSQISLFVPL